MNSKRYRRILFIKTIFVTKIFKLYSKIWKKLGESSKIAKSPRRRHYTKQNFWMGWEVRGWSFYVLQVEYMEQEEFGPTALITAIITWVVL